MKITAISIGNSRISAARLQDADLLETRSAGADDEESWDDLVQWILSGGGEAIKVAASVNPSRAEAFEARFPEPLFFWGRDRSVPMMNRTRRPEETGVDRLLSGYGASLLYGPPLLVVDFGTAFTFNLIDKEGAFLGGAILPGLDLAAASLDAGCSQLPSIDPPLTPVPLVGLDTESAMASGIANGYLGMVETLVERFLAESEKGCRAVATGGRASFFVSNTALFFRHDPDLLLKGIALAYEDARQRISRPLNP